MDNEKLFSDLYATICELIGALDVHRLDLLNGCARFPLEDGWLLLLNGHGETRTVIGDGWTQPFEVGPGHVLVLRGQEPVGYVTPFAEPDGEALKLRYTELMLALNGAIGRAQEENPHPNPPPRGRGKTPGGEGVDGD